MKKIDIVRQILKQKTSAAAGKAGQAFAPTNIALCKYWGKRNGEINLPVTSSLSISLGDKGATTTIKEISAATDQIILNQQPVDLNTTFGRRLCAFLDFMIAQLDFAIGGKINNIAGIVLLIAAICIAGMGIALFVQAFLILW